jgi:Family of unknown function (DUF6262)
MTPNNHTANAVERACTDLARDGRHVTFTAVAAATGLSRSTLYRNTELRAIIEHHQHTLTGHWPRSPTRSPRSARPSTPSPNASAATKNNSDDYATDTR